MNHPILDVKLFSEPNGFNEFYQFEIIGFYERFIFSVPAQQYNEWISGARNKNEKKFYLEKNLKKLIKDMIEIKIFN